MLDAYNFTVYGNVTITVIPAGIPLYTGLDPSTPSSFSTFGSQSFLITGVNLLTTDTAFAVYGRSDLGLNYTAVVRDLILCCTWNNPPPSYPTELFHHQYNSN